ncbi:hypothetical protein FF011L_05020 [Roseimaritima multifibrata]|uniref:Uncharacterized protein n=1 Tax=Roseimaritima multifibrata TaxID=1930274 RepID=A0A517MAF5_9BACT|nr:hypothetical protein [Roseimaritima multifibrata]QDS91767.1 hypothetical protein FF011L_05020 [Roseimaritima multifibrata]
MVTDDVAIVKPEQVDALGASKQIADLLSEIGRAPEQRSKRAVFLASGSHDRDGKDDVRNRHWYKNCERFLIVELDMSFVMCPPKALTASATKPIQ